MSYERLTIATGPGIGCRSGTIFGEQTRSIVVVSFDGFPVIRDYPNNFDARASLRKDSPARNYQ